MTDKINNLVIENCRLMFRNFSGKETKFNPAGRKNFHVVLDEKTAEKLQADGWNIKERPPRDPQEGTLYTMQVSASYDNYPPKIYMISGKVKTMLDEDSVGALDYAEIQNVDLVIRPYQWDVSGRTGIKAYVKNMYVTVTPDDFADKYLDYPSEDLPF